MTYTTHHFGTAKAWYGYTSMVVESEVQAVERSTNPEIKAGEPHQYRVLEALGEIWVWCVPCEIPVLQRQRKTISPLTSG